MDLAQEVFRSIVNTLDLCGQCNDKLLKQDSTPVHTPESKSKPAYVYQS